MNTQPCVNCVELEAALQAERSRHMCREADAKQYYAVIDTAIRVLMQHLYAIDPGGDLPSDQGPGGMLAQCVESVLAQHRDDRKALQAERKRSVRLHDLVRYQRHELFTADLIDAAEFAELVEDHPAVARLEGYDAMRQRAEAAEVLVAQLRPALESAKAQIAAQDTRIIGQRSEIGNLKHDAEMARQETGHYRERLGVYAGLGAIERMQSEITQLRSERAEAVAALEPFSVEARSLDQRHRGGSSQDAWVAPSHYSEWIIRAAELHARLTAGETEKEEKPPQIGCAGWIIGSNYRKRGRLLGDIGKSGEPWYETDDGTRWSAFDVEFRPDEAKEDKPDAD